MATRQNLIDTYQKNPTLQSRYTQQQYLDLFGFGTPATTTTPTTTTTPAATTEVQNIIGQNLNQGGGGGGGGIQELQQTFTRTQPRAPKFDPNINPEAFLTGKGRIMEGSDMEKLYNEYNAAMQYQPGTTGTREVPDNFAVANRAKDFSEYLDLVGYQAPSKYFEEPSLINKGITAVKDFFTDNRFFQPKVAGTLGDRLLKQSQGITSKIPLPGALLAYGRSPFNPASATYNPALVGELNFLEGLSATGQNMIGRDPNSGHLKYGPDSVLAGKNVISGFGSNSYEVALDKYIDKMKARGTIDGVYDPNNLTEAQLAKLKKAEAEKKANTANALKIAEEKIKKEKDFVTQQLNVTADDVATTTKRGGGGGIADAGYGRGGGLDASKMGGGSRQAKSGGQKAGGTGRKDGGWGWADGGRVYLYDRQEMSEGGEAESYEDIIDAYENGVGVLKGESLTDYIRRNRIKLMDPMGDLEKALFGKANGGRVCLENGGQLSESDFPFLINRPGENMGRKKPGLSDYDKDTQDYDYYDDDPIITIPMGKMMKKKSKKKKKKKDREDYSDGGRVYLYDRQD